MTNLDREAHELHDRVYRQRGDIENRLQEQQLALFADRTSISKWWTDQYRLMLAGLAYTLLETMRRTALRGTDLSRSQCRSLRLQVLRIGAVVTRNTSTVAVRHSGACPDRSVFRLIVQRLTAGQARTSPLPPGSASRSRPGAAHCAAEGRKPISSTCPNRPRGPPEPSALHLRARNPLNQSGQHTKFQNPGLRAISGPGIAPLFVYNATKRSAIRTRGRFQPRKRIAYFLPFEC